MPDSLVELRTNCIYVHTRVKYQGYCLHGKKSNELIIIFGTAEEITSPINVIMTTRYTNHEPTWKREVGPKPTLCWNTKNQRSTTQRLKRLWIARKPWRSALLFVAHFGISRCKAEPSACVLLSNHDNGSRRVYKHGMKAEYAQYINNNFNYTIIKHELSM